MCRHDGPLKQREQYGHNFLRRDPLFKSFSATTSCGPASTDAFIGKEGVADVSHTSEKVQPERSTSVNRRSRLAARERTSKNDRPLVAIW
jgi:hypothetical protein